MPNRLTDKHLTNWMTRAESRICNYIKECENMKYFDRWIFMLSFLRFHCDFCFHEPRLYSTLNSEDQIGWSRSGWKPGKPHLNRSWSPARSCFNMLMLCRAGIGARIMLWTGQGGGGGCQHPLLLNQHPFILFNGRAHVHYRSLHPNLISVIL